ncbi:hypothetical protein B0H15DRAFT_797882 [Mycena belliarum]|uniref:Uncharacterized protein n=1 Tax=Mycena belliarum TaxID=1033014 RepID=A0AAD6UHG6_9AGAR|nr:hypothetical protein B0H15DRAFT_797882 [Mycena belliae]
MKFTLSAAVAVFAAALVIATPLTLDSEKRDVYVPPVLHPRAGTVWTVGRTRNVVWNVTNPPTSITNGIGRIMLRKGARTTPVILQANFSILLGQIQVKVPWVENGNDYRVVLFGDSGNFSPAFTITGA